MIASGCHSSIWAHSIVWKRNSLLAWEGYVQCVSFVISQCLVSFHARIVAANPQAWLSRNAIQEDLARHRLSSTRLRGRVCPSCIVGLRWWKLWIVFHYCNVLWHVLLSQLLDARADWISWVRDRHILGDLCRLARWYVCFKLKVAVTRIKKLRITIQFSVPNFQPLFVCSDATTLRVSGRRRLGMHYWKTSATHIRSTRNGSAFSTERATYAIFSDWSWRSAGEMVAGARYVGSNVCWPKQPRATKRTN